MMTGEPRRIELIPVEAGENVKDKKQSRKTIRFNLTLTESTEEACPEFSYVELRKTALGEKKKKSSDPLKEINSDDPFAAEDEAEHDRMLAIAQSFEAKYGGRKKKRQDRIQDLVDLGEGYDEADPFIDNTEAYDEIVPACLTTRFGGFYINSGKLDFREVSDDEDDFQPGTKKKKSRLIASDDEGEKPELGPDGKKKRGRKKKLFKDETEMELMRRKRKKWAMSGGDAGKLIKKRKLSGAKLGRPKIKHTPTVAELMKRKEAAINGVDKAQITADIEENKLLLELSDFHPGVLDPGMESIINNVLNETNQDDSASPTPDSEQPPPLPSSVSPQLGDSIEKIKQEARVSVEGKCKFFKTQVNQLLLDIELRSRQLSSSERNAIFTHLAAYLPCGKETLVKRAKNLRLSLMKEEGPVDNQPKEGSLNERIERLQEEINRVMPGQIERYNTECAVAAQRQQEERAENRELGSTESEDDKSNEVSYDKRRLPHRKFEWIPKIKTLVNDIVRLKLEAYELLKDPTETAEDYLRSFIDTEIRPLWPKGWMQTRMIYKETRGTHGRLTNQSGRMSIQPIPKVLKTFDKIPDIEFAHDAPLPGGLASSGTEPVVHAINSTGPSTTSAVRAAHGGVALSEIETHDLEEKLALNSMLGSPDNAPSTTHLNTKSAPGTPASTSTPAHMGNASRTLLDYASESFLSGSKSKGGVLTMGTVLPDSVPLATSSTTSAIPFNKSGTSEAAAVSSASMLTLATDSLRSISSILKKETGDLKDSQHTPLGHQPSQQHTTDGEPRLPSPPLRLSGSYHNTPLSSRSGNDRYLNQFKEYVGQLKKQQSTSPTPTANSSASAAKPSETKKVSPPSVTPNDRYLTQYKEYVGQMQQQQQSTSPTPAASSSVSGSKPIDIKKPSPPSITATGSSSLKTNWDLQQLSSRSNIDLNSQGTVSSGMYSASSPLSSSVSHKSPNTQTQVHQVSSSLSKSQVNQSQGLKINIPGSYQGQNTTMGQKVSPGQSFMSEKRTETQQRSVQSQNQSLNQRSSQGQGQGLTGQNRSFQLQSFQENIRKSIPPTSSPIQRGSHSTNSSSMSGGQVSTCARQPQQVMGLASMSHTPQTSKTSTAGNSNVHSPNKVMTPSSPVTPPSPTVPSSPQSLGFSGPKRHAPSPTSGSASSIVGYKAAINKPSTTGTHNGSQRSHMTSPDPSSPAQLSHILDSSKNQKSKTPPSGDIVYSNLTMAQIMASSPSDTRKHYATESTKPTSDSHTGMWNRVTNHVKPVNRQSAGVPSPGLPVPSPPSPSQQLPKAGLSVSSSTPHYSLPTSRSAHTSSTLFMQPATTTPHSSLRLSDLQRDTVSRLTHAALSTGNMPVYSHGSPVQSNQNQMTPPSPQYPQTPPNQNQQQHRY